MLKTISTTLTFAALIGSTAVACGSGDPNPAPPIAPGGLSSGVSIQAHSGPRKTRGLRPPNALEADGPVKCAPGAIDYNGGPIMTGTVNVYGLFYGNTTLTWPGAIGALVESLGGSPYLAITTSYAGANDVPPSNSLEFAGATVDTSYSVGTTLNQSTMQQLINDAIAAKTLPEDSNGIYIVFGGSDITEQDFDGAEWSTFCTDFCGWHADYSDTNGVDLKYAFIGDPMACPESAPCMANLSGTPSGDPALDAALSASGG